MSYFAGTQHNLLGNCYSSPKSFSNSCQVNLLLVNGFTRLRRVKPLVKPFRITIYQKNYSLGQRLTSLVLMKFL